MIVDLHYHTCVPGPLRPRELLEYDRRNGLVYTARLRRVDAICLTEHDTVWQKEAVRALTEEHGLLVLRGMEVSTNYADFGHVLVYGLSRYISGIWDVKKLAHVVEQEGGAMFVAHPFREVYAWGGESWIASLTVQEASEMPIFELVHGIEVLNGATHAHDNEFAQDVCRNLGLPGTGGSDAHSTVGLGACATVFENPITSEEDLVRELRAGNFRPAVRKEGSFAVPSTA